ncbi:MAG: Omp28-related outer membrane protein [Bacteroidales bacterium]|nr:Omp28-related outer membrane protein [Bacteroidales bacterium]
MKKIALWIAAVFVLAACDKIEKPYKVEHPKVLISVDTPQFEVIDRALQKILVEEYTGHKCSNCPAGRVTIEELTAAMKDTLVVLALHAGVDGQVKPDLELDLCDKGFGNDYRTTAGNQYAKDFGISKLPVAVFNRTRWNDKYEQERPNWKEVAGMLPRTQAGQGLQIIPVWNEAADTLFVFVNATLFNDASRSMRLTVLMSEDSIVSPQMNTTPYGANPVICDYVHSHMLRANISPIDGTALKIASAGESVICAYALKWSSLWKKNDSHIIAFISDADTHEVLQAEECKLKE